jgi:hypothetical protein
MRGFLLIGAPRFELGTSSPPGLFSHMAGAVPRRREVACEQRKVRTPTRFQPLFAETCFMAFGHGLGTAEVVSSERRQARPQAASRQAAGRDLARAIQGCPA